MSVYLQEIVLVICCKSSGNWQRRRNGAVKYTCSEVAVGAVVMTGTRGGSQLGVL